jgi:TonB family protein
MRSAFTILSGGVSVIIFCFAHGLQAQGEANPGASASGSVTPNRAPSPRLSAPELKEHPEPVYPAEALAQRLSASVELELTIDARGQVSDARVLTPAGHGFDEAALRAVRTWTFEPAKQGGMPVQSLVQLTIPFEPPPPAPISAAPSPSSPTPPSPPAAASAAAPPPAQASQAAQSTLVLGRRPISAASSMSVRDRDFALRPVGSVQDILRVTPGLVMVQHSGGGKASQYFLRGFDADHGTDLALSVDGIPINLVSHAHGQGFSDTNFIIPEVVERVEITKGPYFAGQGDFATAGAVNLVTRDNFEHSSIGLGFGGSPGHGGPTYRGLLIASPAWDTAKALFAVEVGRQEGPFDNPEGWDRYKLFNKLSVSLTPTSTLSVGESSYAGNWHGSGQVPGRAVEEGVISRFGSLDPDEGGNTARHQVFASYKLRPSETSEFNALSYLASYRFNLFSNFSLYLDDQGRGDEIQQVDRRVFSGGQMSYRVVRDLGPLRLDTTIGGNVRSDDIHEELWHTEARQELDPLRANDVHQTFLGAFVNEELAPAPWLRFDLGGRADLLSFAVDNLLPSDDPQAPKTGVSAAHQLSPKTSLVLTPVSNPDLSLDLYANYGHGFHSNDVRGAFAVPAITPLTRAIGAEIGSRARLWGRLDLAAALWQLDLDNETVWSGDQGTTEVSGATRRKGVELESRFEFTSWLAADLDLTFTQSAFRENAGNGNGLALAPKQTWSGGLSGRYPLGPGTARAGLRFYGIGDRPASDDGVLVAPGFTEIDAHLGYRQRWFDVAFDVENLLNGKFRSAQFDTVSRLPTEPGIGQPLPANFGCGSKGRLASNPATGALDGAFWGCEEVDYTPAYPLTLRILATVFLD